MISKIERKKQIGKISALVVMGMFLAISIASPVSAIDYLNEDDTWVIVDDPTDGHIRWLEDNGEKMRLTDGNLGIGTTSPGNKLTVAQDIPIDKFGDGQIRIQGVSDPNQFLSFKLDTPGNFARIQAGDDSAGANVNYPLSLNPSGGNVGIGTESPDNLLDIEKSGTASSNLDIFHITNRVNAQSMAGTETSILFNQWYYDASDPAVADAGRITVGTETDWTSTDSTQDGYMAFSTVKDGTVSEQVRITSDGNVGIGTTSPQGALDVVSTTGGLIVPRMTTAQRNALTAVNGMIIYNTSTNTFNFYEDGAWVTGSGLA